MLKRIIYLAAIVAAPFALILLTRDSTTWAARVLEKRYPPPGRMVPVGDYKLQLFCSGSGSPAIIIEPGMGVDWVGWRFVIPKLVSTNRVCVYDRAGYGWSEAGPMPRTALLEAGELHIMLTQAGIAQPYILVAHSFGGYIARIYASRFPESLRAVVLVDPSVDDERAPSPKADPQWSFRRVRLHDVIDLVPPLGIARLKRLYRGEQALDRDLRELPPGFQNRALIASSLTQLRFERNEFDSLSLSEAQMRSAPFPPHVPLTVITAGRPQGSDADIYRDLHKKLARSSLSGRYIVAETSGHMIPIDQPNLIVEAIRVCLKDPGR